VAAGNADTAAAAVEVLRAGGNAVDAVVAAGFAAGVSEPALSSLGGGGFLLAALAGGPVELFDFFVTIPGHDRAPGDVPASPDPVTVHFAGADQVFSAGWGSVAVPGCLDGYLHAHRRRGRLPLAEVVAPAGRLAARGAVLDPTQASLLRLLGQILLRSPEGRSIVAPGGVLLQAGERMSNPALADVLVDIASERVTGFASPLLAGPLAAACERGGGLLTAGDLGRYEVVEREPLRATYRGGQIATNPPPSFGGSLVLAALAELEGGGTLDGSPDSYVRLASVLVAMSDRHVAVPYATRGTTHISVVDGEGGVAAMTTSNGSCSGEFAPGTGIALNNMLGEADLHPHGWADVPPGTRVSSMMAPTLVTTADGTVVGLGSGGSERIRSVLTCVLSGLLDRGLPLAAALHAPRLHWDRTVLQVEPGLDPALPTLRQHWPVHEWPRRDLYFGGAHAVGRSREGAVEAAGDERRGGVGVVVDLP